MVGKGLIAACDVCPALKPMLRNWGMRTDMEWFGNRVVNIPLPGGPGFRLASAADNYLSFQLFWNGGIFYEPITRMVVEELLEPGDTFFDVGSNIGFYSLVVAASKPGVNIYAFEPNPRIYAMLTRNTAANGFKITCEPVAVSDIDGIATLYLSESDHSASLIRDFEETTESVEVPAVTLDSYVKCHDVRKRMVIKLDTEGNDEAVFRGAHETISAFKPDIIKEVALMQDNLFASFLREEGYRFYQITDRGLVESPMLTPVVRGPYIFLNYLLSAQPRHEVAEIFNRIERDVRRIDLDKTSKLADAAVLERAVGRIEGRTSAGGAGVKVERRAGPCACE
jgi:FkbM family methyltransferase